MVVECSCVCNWEIGTIIGVHHCGAGISDGASIPFHFGLFCAAQTVGNGKEFAGYEQIARLRDVDFYFARPYASSKRGSNEYANGLIRQLFSKNQEMISMLQRELNEAMGSLVTVHASSRNANSQLGVWKESFYF